MRTFMNAHTGVFLCVVTGYITYDAINIIISPPAINDVNVVFLYAFASVRNTFADHPNPISRPLSF
jgi:Co/Zn/Cd efflux system component